MTPTRPTVSVIVPARNAEGLLPRCLDAILASTYPAHEIFVIDDLSEDGTGDVARSRGARLIRTDRISGPGAARNLAVQQAAGEIVMFVDADVVIEPDALERVAGRLAADPDVAAVFGSYDEEPGENNFLSQYKNLFHHFVHQHSASDAHTFWAGCGAVRRSVFLELGGFDAERYPRPTIEDIELGYRLRHAGHRIVLDKRLRGKHLKRWTVRSLLHADILCRGVPWTRLILETGEMNYELNLRLADRISAILTGLSLLVLPAAVIDGRLLVVLPLLLLAFLLLNREFYAFFLARRGVAFTLRVFPFHVLYYLYSSGAFALGWLLHTCSRIHRADRWAIPAMGLVAVVYVVALLPMPTGVFWSPDEGAKLMHLHSVTSVAWDGELSLAVPYPGRTIDPELAFYPNRLHWSHPDSEVALLYPRPLEGGGVELHWPIWFPAISILPLGLFGLGGLHVIPLLSGLLIVALSGCLSHHLASGSARWTLVAVGLATPVLFYSLLFWEHTPAVLLAMAAFWQASQSNRRPWRSLLLAGLFLGAATVLRLEMLLFVAALGAGILTTAAMHRQRLSAGLLRKGLIAAAVLAVALVFLYRSNVSQGSWIGQSALILHGLDRLTDSGAWTIERLRRAWVNHAELPGPIMPTALAWCSFVGIGMCALATAVGRRLRYVLLSTGGSLFAAGSLFVAIDPTRYREIHALFLSAPFLVFGVLFLLFARHERRFECTLLGTTTLAYWAGGTAGALTGLDGGLEWGMRYLLVAYPLGAICAVVGIRHYAATIASLLARRWFLSLGALLLLISFQLELRGVAEVHRTKRQLAEFDRILQQVDTPAITDLYWLPAALTQRYLEQEIYVLSRQEDLDDWLKAVGSRVDGFVFVSDTPLDPGLLRNLPIELVPGTQQARHGMIFSEFRLRSPAGTPALASLRGE